MNPLGTSQEDLSYTWRVYLDLSFLDVSEAKNMTLPKPSKDPTGLHSTKGQLFKKVTLKIVQKHT
jgi:hypothetical protein